MRHSDETITKVVLALGGAFTAEQLKETWRVLMTQPEVPCTLMHRTSKTICLGPGACLIFVARNISLRGRSQDLKTRYMESIEADPKAAEKVKFQMLSCLADKKQVTAAIWLFILTEGMQEKLTLRLLVKDILGRATRVAVTTRKKSIEYLD